jgi:hypothetical protein
VGPIGTTRTATCGVGDKNISFFGGNASQIAIFMIVSPFWSSYNLTGGSGMMGKAGPNWVKKVFNCFRYL